MTTYRLRHPCSECNRPGTRTFRGYPFCTEHYADVLAEAFRSRHIIVAIEDEAGDLTCETCELVVYPYAKGHRHDLERFRRIEREGRLADWSESEKAAAWGR